MDLSEIYDKKSVNLRGKALAGFIRPTLAQFFTSKNYIDVLKVAAFKLTNMTSTLQNTMYDWTTYASFYDPGSSKLYLCGGYSAGSYTSAVYSTTAASNYQTQVFEGNLPEMQGGSKFKLIDGYVYWFGGYTSAGGWELRNSIRRTTIENFPGGWTTLPETLPNAVYIQSTIDVGNTMWFIGGNNAFSTNRNYLWKTDLNTPNVVTNEGTLPFYTNNTGEPMIIGDTVYVLGSASESSSVVLNKLWSAPLSDLTNWTFVKDFPENTGACTTDGKTIISLGGRTSYSNAIHKSTESDPLTLVLQAETLNSPASLRKSIPVPEGFVYVGGDQATDSSWSYFLPVSQG